MGAQLKKNALVVAGLLGVHLTLSFIMSLMARSPYMSGFHNGQGLWRFAGDSSRYHADALRLLELFHQGQVYEGLTRGRWWHTKWVALSYMLFGADPLSFAVINAIIWVMSIICVYKIVLHILPERRHVPMICAAMFGFWPSYLLHTTQLLKEPFFVFGVLLVVWGWTGLLAGHRRLSLVMYVVLGILLAYLNRAHSMLPLTGVSVIAVCLMGYRARGSLVYALVTMALVISLAAVHKTRFDDLNMEHLYHLTRTDASNQNHDKLSRWIDAKVYMLTAARFTFTLGYRGAKSNIDEHVTFRSLPDIIQYMPKALLVGYFAPFPAHWFERGATVGYIGRALAGFEMVGWYVLFIGSVSFFVQGTVPLRLRIWLLVYTISLVMISALMISNVGALYRMRYVYLLPMMIGGVEGWARCRVQKALW
ncbi:MAG: hypothetical protein ETSY1_20915 [Candidatus Entotheonella factor]|uniref:Glycosyltransferase RgtA/B/C/D-like domain-containing protein n=1 Tax=Entotheonella factor TaxID=1429438 RepID=W4LKP4_ENTF1|nr:MAG: hypothetical protein ETSY1_20915 [Candidatus Entotheonella factor]